MRKRTLLFVVVGLIALVLGAKSLEPFLVASQPQEMRFPDGKRMRLLDATFGTRHSYTISSQGWLSKMIPEWARSYLRIPPPETLEVKTRGTTMVLWVEDPDGANLVADTFILTGDDGTEQMQQQAEGTTFFGAGRQAIVFESFPRRANEIQVIAVIRGPTGSRITSEPLTIKNRLPIGSSSKFTPATLPAVSHDRATKFTLIDLASSKIDLNAPEENSSYYDYAVEESKASTVGWSSRPVRISNAEGDLAEQFSYGISGDRVSFSNGLPTASPWKLELEYYKSSGFEKDELVEIRGVAVPAAGTETELNQELSTPEAKLKLKAFGNGKYELGSATHTEPWQALIFENPPGAEVKVIELRDDQGNETTPVRFSSNKEWILIRFQLPPGVKSIDLTLALVPKYRAEFIVQPRTVTAVPK